MGFSMGFSWDLMKGQQMMLVLTLMVHSKTCSIMEKTSRIRRDLQLEIDITGLI